VIDIHGGIPAKAGTPVATFRKENRNFRLRGNELVVEMAAAANTT
jgi:hypothetical protein